MQYNCILNNLMGQLLVFHVISPSPSVNTAQQLSSTAKELENEKGKVAQLKRDMEGLKKKSKAEQEKAARLVYLISFLLHGASVFILHICSFRQRVRGPLSRKR